MFGKEIEKRNILFCVLSQAWNKEKIMSPRGGYRGHIYYMLIG